MLDINQMPWKTGNKSFSYYGINIKKKNAQTHTVHLFLYLLLRIKSVYLGK